METAAELASELFFLLAAAATSDDESDGAEPGHEPGHEPEHEPGHEPGYERTAEQRREDCELVREILGRGVAGVHANLRHSGGTSMLALAIEYDHRHPAEMIRVVVEAG